NLSVEHTTGQGVFNGSSGKDYQIVIDGGYTYRDGLVAMDLHFDYALCTSISAPDDGASYPGQLHMPVTIDPTTNNGSIANVELFLDVFSLGKKYGPLPFTFLTPKIAGGTFALKAVATDFSGQQTTSAPINISVSLTNDLWANRVLLDGYRFTGF